MERIEYRVIIKRKDKEPHRGNPMLDQWRAHEKRRFLMNEADPHFRCDHESGDFLCLNEVEWVKIQKRAVSEWVDEADPDPVRT